MNDLYKGYDSWEKMLKMYENADFRDKETRRRFREDFEIVSRLMWEHWIVRMYLDDLAEQLSETWFNLEGIDFNSVVEAYEEAYAYCWYASDRMSVNRWFRIRVLLNYDVEQKGRLK